MANIYIAIIGDIVNSKKIAEREKTQQRLQSCLDEVNQSYSGIASKFMITLGDEFQGLLSNGGGAVEIIESIQNCMYPLNIRFGIGVGEITTGIRAEMPLGADGPAYYNAREMINQLKQFAGRKRASYSNIKICGLPQSDADGLINEILGLCSLIRSKWTERQLEVIAAVNTCGGNQQKAAESLGITQSTVHSSLYSSGYYTYLSAIKTVAKVLSEIGENN